LKVWPVLGIAVIQAILCLAHWLLFTTAVSFWPIGTVTQHWLSIALAVLSFSFVFVALLGYRFRSPVIEYFYTAASVWLGFLNFFFWGACLCWLVAIPAHFLGGAAETHIRIWTADALLAVAVLAGLYGLVNATQIRERRITVALPNLPQTWRGRTALLLSDLHLGHVNRVGFSRKIAAIAKRLNPAVIFIAGDLYDGSKVDPSRLAAPLLALQPPLSIYFCGGNHEEIGDEVGFEAALGAGGVHVLNNELADVNGLQVAGVRYVDTTFPLRLRGILEKMHVDRSRASILLNHVPNRLPLVEQAGFNLQLSGHTHGGQVFPFTWFAHRAFGRFTRGLNSFGTLQVLTSMGAGTWGPPMRVGTAPEVFLITFESAD